MKKLLAIATIAVFVFSSAVIGYAGPTATVNVLVTIEKSVSVEVGGGPVNLGTVGISETAKSGSPITVKNNGSGADETITLSVTDPAGWTQGTPGENTYRVSFQFSEDGSGTTWQAASEVSESVVYDATKKLWIKLETPTATDVTTQQTIQVTISAE